MAPYFFLHILVPLALSGIPAILAVQPDVIVRIMPSSFKPSDHPTAEIENDGDSIEILVKRAQFGSRNNFLEGTLVLPPEYDPFLCEHDFTIEIDESGNSKAYTLPPYTKPDEESPTVMLVPRGDCTFERKAYAAKRYYGARGIMIYDRLGAHYRWNETANQVIFPKELDDYECGNGEGVMYNIALDPPAYNPAQLDPLMGMTIMTTPEMATISASNVKEPANPAFRQEIDVLGTSMCNLNSSIALNACASQLCLVTSHKENSSEYPVCCAWDTPITMPRADDARQLETDDILAAWLTIRQSEIVLKSDLLSRGNRITMESRSKSAFNASYIFVWMWGTLVMMIGSWYAAGEYRRFGAKLAAYKASENKNKRAHCGHRRREQRNDDLAPSLSEVVRKPIQSEQDGDDLPKSSTENASEDQVVFRLVNDDRPGRKRTGGNGGSKKKKSKKKQQNQEVWSLHSLPPAPRRKMKKKSNTPESTFHRNPRIDTYQPSGDEEIGIGMTTIPPRESGIISSSEMTQWHVAVFIVISSATLLLLYFIKIAYKFFLVLYGIGCAGAVLHVILNPLVATLIPKFGDRWVEEFNKPVICGCNGFSVTSQLVAYTWVGVWVWYGFTKYQPQTNAFFWVSLNIFGACVCILSASVLKLNSIKIAIILLVAIFVYDIFFVFITPFLTGGASIMLDVATGSENLVGDERCYRYPSDWSCRGFGYLPMLFVFPKVNNYANGSVILGLGDIVLPGFLIAFGARHDEASRLIGAHMPNANIPIPTTWYNGYFYPMLVSYSIGLFLAFLAVILTQQGQPALLYICPVCLTSILLLGRNDLKGLWNGAKVFRLTDRLVTKTERKWGEARMKRFADQRRRENDAVLAASGNESDPERIGRESRSEELATDLTETMPCDPVRPRSKDVCLGYEDHPGTKVFRDVIANVAADLGEEEYKPEIYHIIKRKLKGRRFFVNDDESWEEASKFKTRKEVGLAYDKARGKGSIVIKDFDTLTLPEL